MSDNTDLRICNLVSRGYSVSEAKAIVGPLVEKEAEEKAAAQAEASEPKTVDELRAALEAAKIEYHPNAKETALRKLWNNRDK